MWIVSPFPDIGKAASSGTHMCSDCCPHLPELESNIADMMKIQVICHSLPCFRITGIHYMDGKSTVRRAFLQFFQHKAHSPLHPLCPSGNRHLPVFRNMENRFDVGKCTEGIGRSRYSSSTP